LEIGVDAHHLAQLASLIADPSRAAMLAALMGGRALTATELANAAEISRPTASEHLTRLKEGGLLDSASQGKHRYFRLANHDVAQMLEHLLGMAYRSGSRTLATGPRDPAMRECRVCYDHLAGASAVALFERLIDSKTLTFDGPRIVASAKAVKVFGALGIDVNMLSRARRPLCRSCLDWSERREHLAGALGAALLELALDSRWATRLPDSRVVTFTTRGAAAWAAIGAV
jgi:DNA-binding transcriptional ArsR family regulator